MFNRKLTSRDLDYVAGSLVCYAAAVLLLLFGIKAVTRFAERPFDIVVGVLAASAVAVTFVILGVQLMRSRKRTECDCSP